MLDLVFYTLILMYIMHKQENFMASLSITGLVIIVIIALYFVLNYFLVDTILSAVISIIVVMFGVIYFVGKELIGWTIFAVLAAAIVVGLFTSHITAIAMVVVGLCLLIIGALLLRE